MKLKMMFAAAFAALLVACGGSVENKPEEVTKAFVKRMADKDISGAKELCTKATRGDLDKLKDVVGLMPAQTLEKEEVKCETNGDKATCTFCCVAGKSEETYELVKEDGNWRVVFSKDGGASKKMEESMEKMEETMEEMTDTTGAETNSVE
ncbi:MAG TPA: hypothetical protein VD905_14620 [Flavobacteriales bacterium]|nr:hypothetical protein [Flavobacteriales bacterium]